MVVADHALITLVEKAGATIDVTFAYSLGALGVRIFFAISGFVMILAHGNDFGGLESPRHFMKRRISRIVPLYWVTSAIYFLKLEFTGANPSLAGLALSLLFIPHFGEPGAIYGHPTYGLGWTLQYEMAFYVIFAGALLFSKRVGITLIFLTFLCLCGSVASGMIPIQSVLGYFGNDIVVYFLLGMAIGLLREKIRAILAIGPDFFIAASCASLATVVAMALHLYTPPNVLIDFVTCTLIVAPCCLAIETRKFFPVQILLKTSGDASYSIYLTHSFVIGPLARICANIWPNISTFFFLIASITISLFVGILVYRFVETPLLKFSNYITNIAVKFMPSKKQSTNT